MASDLAPRERLLRHGAQGLSDAELLAVVLRNGSPGLSALGAAQRLLAAAGGLGGLLSADRTSLGDCGAGDGRAAVVLAAAELARRMSRSRIAGRGDLSSAAAVAAYLQLRSGLDEQEVVGALYLNVHNRLLADREIFRGTLTQATVEPRPILSLALRHRAARFILWHSHPGGDPEPTVEDLAFTRRMLEAGKLLGIRLLDHLILGCQGRWISLARRGSLAPESH
jgi:DNA repair protein RadC